MEKYKPSGQFKYQSNLIIKMLNDNGYNSTNLYRLLKCAPNRAYPLILEPELLTVLQIKLICFAIQKPFGFVCNTLMYVPKSSPHWLDEEYNPGVHVLNIKRSR